MIRVWLKSATGRLPLRAYPNNSSVASRRSFEEKRAKSAKVCRDKSTRILRVFAEDRAVQQESSYWERLLASFALWGGSLRVDRLATDHADLITQKCRRFKVELFHCSLHFFLFLFDQFFRIFCKTLFVQHKQLLECLVVRRHHFLSNI